MPRPRVTFSRNGSTSSGPRPAERDQQQGVVGRRRRGAWRHRRSRTQLHRRRRPGYAAGDARLRTAASWRARRARCSRGRPGRPAADLDGRPRHRAAGRRRAPAPTALAGAVSAAYLVANAVVAVLLGRLGRPARPAAGAARRRARCSSSGWSLLVVAVEAGWPRPGATSARPSPARPFPPIGAWCGPGGHTSLDEQARRADGVRPRGRRRRGDLHRRPDAGDRPGHRCTPAAGLVPPRSPALGGTARAACPAGTEPPAAAAPGRGRGPAPMHWWMRARRSSSCCFGLGILFGGAEVATVAFTEEQGNEALRRGAAGALGRWGACSAGMVTARSAGGSTAAPAAASGPLALAAAHGPAAASSSSCWLMARVLFVAGFAIAPDADRHAGAGRGDGAGGPADRGHRGDPTGILIGVAPGAALCGAVVDAYGAASPSASRWLAARAGRWRPRRAETYRAGARNSARAHWGAPSSQDARRRGYCSTRLVRTKLTVRTRQGADGQRCVSSASTG